jgi:hypothetical protein
MSKSSAKVARLTEKGLTFRVNDVAAGKALLPVLSHDKVIAAVLQKQTEPASGAQKLPTIVDEGGYSKHKCVFVDQDSNTGNAFIDAVTTAFDYHYPLLLKPDHFWLMVVQGVAIHTNKNAEELRSNWVKRKGKKTLTVNRDAFVLGAANDWAGVVAEFEKQIRANTVAGAVDMLTLTFSTTTPNETVAAQVAVMDVPERFFNYRVKTKCGFPEITLAGTKEDWQQLAARSVNLVKTKCVPDLATRWAHILESVYERILATFDGTVDVEFWESFCKEGGLLGSGGDSWLNGWFNAFLPYGLTEPNRTCHLYVPKEMRHKPGYCLVPRDPRGLALNEIPTGFSIVPVQWQCNGNSIPLQFRAGFIGVTQDPETKYISPEVGWVLQSAPAARKRVRAEE